MTAIDKAANSLDTFLRILLGIVSLAILAGTIFLMVKLDSALAAKAADSMSRSPHLSSSAPSIRNFGN